MDNFIVSARKYRPVTFESVVGQQHITGTLKNAIKNNQLAQAFLFCGPRGVGKTTCARILAKTINCQNLSSEIEACGICESCLAFQNGASFNVHELDAASNNSVEDIRNLIEQVRIPPQTGAYKIYIIDEVHMLSAQAFNAFLKTLEEPPAYAKFILATTEKHKILPTILSRCQIFDFNRIGVEDIAEHLETIARKEEVNYDQDGLHLIAQKADGGLRDALSMFDQLVSFSNKNLNYQAVIDNLNVLDYDYYFKLTQAILDEDSAKCLLLFNEVLSKGFDGSHFIAGLANHFRNLLVAKDMETVQLLEVSKSIKDRYLNQAEKTGQGLLLSALNIANQCEINYKSSRNQRLQVELALLKMCHISAAVQLSKQALRDNESSESNKKKTSVTKSPQQTKGEHASVPLSRSAVSTKYSESSPERTNNPASANTSTSLNPGSAAEQNLSTTTDGPKGFTQSTAPSSLNEPERPAGRTKLVIPKLTDINLSDKIPNLNTVFDEKADEGSKSKDPQYIQGEGEDPFDQDMFLEFWKKFAISVKKEGKISLFTLMTANVPVLKENFMIDVIVENQIQQRLLVESKIDILNFIRQGLNNFKIDLTPILQKSPSVRKPVTDSEKYQAMVAKNPMLDKFRKDFNLGFD